jgi:predicted amidohydrolase YtcJ
MTYGADERVAVEDALRAYTRGGAYAAGVEHEVGMISTRQRADLVVLDKDPTAIDTVAIESIGVLATMVGGQLVHDRAELFA